VTRNNDHIGKSVVDNRTIRYQCDHCDNKPDTIAVIMRGGYVQKQLCSKCYTEQYPKDPIFDKGVIKQ